MLERAIEAGIITEAQARDADAYADGLASRIVSGDLSIEQARAQAERDASRDGTAIRASRARRGLPPISLLSVFLVLAASSDAPEPEPNPFELLYPNARDGEPECGKRAPGYHACRRPAGHAPPCWHEAAAAEPDPAPTPRRPPEDDPGPELAPGEVLYTVPYDPEAMGAHVRGRVVRAVLGAARIARENGWSAGALRLDPRWHETSLRAACVRQAVKVGARAVIAYVLIESDGAGWRQVRGAYSSEALATAAAEVCKGEPCTPPYFTYAIEPHELDAPPEPWE
jgi:hypothetical protein